MTDLITREFGIHGVRILVRDGDPWFVANDVARVLDVGNSSDLVATLDDDERGFDTVETPGGSQSLRVVSESGLYSIIMRSRKPDAKVFKRWVTHEVLPSIRRTGAYGTPAPLAALNDPAALRNLLLGYTERVLELEATVSDLAPKAHALDALTGAPETLLFREAVKILHRTTAVTEGEARALMIKRGWITRLGRRLAPAHYGQTQGYVTSIDHEWTDDAGATHATPQLRITQKGLARLSILLTREAA